MFLNNFLIKNHTFGIKTSPLCSFCNLSNKTPFHIFYESECVKYLWSDLVQCFQNNLVLSTSTPQTIISGILDSATTGSIFKINKIFITFYLYLCYVCYKCVSPEKVHKFE